ncbi:MAG: hypothetical protein RJA37_1619 [Verrucomicrobiota bacterium]
MKSLLRTLTILALAAVPCLTWGQAAAAAAPAEPAKPAPAAASIEQRVGDLEAYVNNLGPKAGDDKVAAGPIAASAGPGPPDPVTTPSSWSAPPWCSS